MQTDDATYLEAIKGSTQPIFKVDVFYDGEIVYNDLPITGGQVSIDSTQAVPGSVSLVVNDPDGELVPTGPTSALAPFGGYLNVKAGITLGNNDMTFSLGWFDIIQGDPTEAWRWLGDGATVVKSASSFSITGRDFMGRLSDAKFLTTEAPVETNTFDEITRLVDNILPTEKGAWTWPDFSASSVTYSTDRLEAIKSVAALAGLIPYANQDGTLAFRPSNFVGDTWPVNAGPDGTMGKFTRSMQRALVNNAVKVTGTDSNGNPITVVMQQTEGPYRWGGPFGRNPADEVSDPLLTTLDAVNARAAQLLATSIAGNPQSIDVPTVLNYALEIGDQLEMTIPYKGTITAPISKIVFPARGMQTVTVDIPGEF